MSSGKVRAPWREHAAVGFALLGALLVIFRGDLFSGSDLFFQAFRDVHPIIAWYPWSRIELASWGQGLFPLWNPYEFLGQPFLASYQPCILSPLTWPLLLLPFEAFAVPYLFIRLLLAGWGMFLFCRRIGIGRAGSTLAALAFGLTGYLIQYVNDIHIVIDLLLPFLLLAGENLVTRARKRDFIFLTALTALVLLGGQPSSALFTLAFSGSYLVFRALIHSFFQPDAKPADSNFFGGLRSLVISMLMLMAATATAGLLALPQLLPFFEFIPQAWTFHTSGFGSSFLDLPGLVTWIAPGFFGPLDQASQFLPLLKTAPYLGAVPAALALAALFRPRQSADWFFGASLVFCVGLLSGAPPFRYLGRLPGLSVLTFIKYLQPLAAFSAAVLAARMLEQILAGRGWQRVAGASGLIFGAAVLARLVFGDWFPQAQLNMNGALLMAGVLLAGLTAVAFLARSKTTTRGPGLADQRARPAAAAILVLVWLELGAASAVNHPPQFLNPAKTDFTYLKDFTRADPLGRITADPEVFMANLALLAPVYDIRIADVMIIKSSMDLYQWMMGFSDREINHDFMKYHSFRVQSPMIRYQISKFMGIRYFLTREIFPRNQTLEKAISLADFIAPSPRHGGRIKLAVGDDLRSALFAHPPSRWDLDARGIKFWDPKQGVFPLWLSAGIDPRVRDLPGDGVWFMLASGKEDLELNYSRYLDPRKQAADRAWKDVAFAEMDNPDLALITLPGKSDDNDWAAWGDLRLGADQPKPPTQMTRGVRVYEDPRALPRAYLARGVMAVLSNEQMMYDMEDLRAVPDGAILESSADLPPVVPDRGQGLLRIEEYGLQSVRLYAQVPAPELMVLADAYYPGWKVLVDKQEKKILRVNRGLRGVALNQGENKVEFVYQPAGFRIGLWAGICSLLTITILFKPPRRRGRGEIK